MLPNVACKATTLPVYSASSKWLTSALYNPCFCRSGQALHAQKRHSTGNRKWFSWAYAKAGFSFCVWNFKSLSNAASFEEVRKNVQSAEPPPKRCRSAFLRKFKRSSRDEHCEGNPSVVVAYASDVKARTVERKLISSIQRASSSRALFFVLSFSQYPLCKVAEPSCPAFLERHIHYEASTSGRDLLADDGVKSFYQHSITGALNGHGWKLHFAFFFCFILRFIPRHTSLWSGDKLLSRPPRIASLHHQPFSRVIESRQGAR